ncbi:MAG: YitT family protein [Clostridia bacterium]|nr:YitT family protein [Clostridia bacterium]
MKKRTIRKFFANINYRNFSFTLFGSALVALGSAIHIHSNAADGGIIGMSRVIEYYSGGKIPFSLATLLLNVLFYLIAWRLMNAEFISNMAVGTVLFTVFSYFFKNYLSLDIENVFLATLLGMVFIELGTGLMLRYGSAPNGEHVLSMAISKRGDIDFGWFNFIKDLIIILMFIPMVDKFSAIISSLVIMTICTPVLDYIATAPKKSSVKKNVEKNKRHWVAILITGFIIALIFAAGTIYINDYYKADESGIENLNYETVEKEELDNGFTAYVPKGEIKAGFVFYPGAKVEYSAYAPLLQACADRGILSIVVKMPLNLAFLGMNKALNAITLYPDVENWYIGGHSLGGSMAASCASANPNTFDGVVLLASYSTADLNDLSVLSIYGDKDSVLNAEKYENNKKNLPSDLVEYVIEGGNHAYFGMYGNQSGDGKATITNVDQINLTADYIVKFILE